MKKEGLLLLAVVGIIVMSTSVFAGYTYRNNTIETSYTAGGIIRGTVNMSFSAEPANSTIKSNFNGTIMLIDLLRRSNFTENTDYTCSIRGCISDYALRSDSPISGFDLSGSESKIIGFDVSGNSVQVSSLKFSLASNAGASCSRQMLIDVLDKNESFIQSIKQNGNPCDVERWGCFNTGLGSYITADITTSSYCENITLPSAAAYKIGANVKNSTTTAGLKMEMFDSEWNLLKGCDLPANTIDTEKLGCIVNYTNTREREFFVCVHTTSASSNYKIRVEQSGANCGTDSQGPPYNLDYEIFAQPIGFDSPGTLDVNSSVFYDLNSAELVTYVDDYINEKYQRNCSSGCFIPFAISGLAQTVTLGSAELRYTLGTPTIYSDNRIYLLDKTSPTISTPNTINIPINNARFTIPLTSTENKFMLYVGDSLVLSKNINITPSFDFDIAPKIILMGVNTLFQAITYENISHSSWNFGDGTTADSSSKLISHKYIPSVQKNYTVEVVLLRKDGREARKSFDVGAGSLQESANMILNASVLKLANITSQIGAFPSVIAEQIKKEVNTTEINSSLTDIRTELTNVTEDSRYVEIMNQLLALNIPSSISVREEGKSLPLAAIGFSDMDTSYIEDISNIKLGSETERENTKAKIVAWLDKTYSAVVDYETIAKTTDNASGGEDILTKVKIGITEKSGVSGNKAAYLIIGYPEGSIVFMGNYSEKVVGSGVYLPVNGAETIEFIIPKEIKLSELGIYISPTLDKLGEANVPIVPKPEFNWTRFILWFSVLVVIAFAIYIALQEWYKKHYESSLFKNPSDIYNIINFIYNSRKGGLNDDETSKKLKGAGWKGEQIAYAFKKIDGKRTGMFEIPIFRFFENRKIKAEIESRQAKSLLNETKSVR